MPANHKRPTFLEQPAAAGTISAQKFPVPTVTPSSHNNYMPIELGFKNNKGGAHAARTMMLEELRTLLDYVRDDERSLLAFQRAIEDDNCLNKRSGKSRSLTFRHLIDLYALEPDVLLFRGLTYFWQRDESAQPLLALTMSLARDGLLAAAAPFIWKAEPGSTISRDSVEQNIASRDPDRFSPATLKSVAQNINSSLTQSGHLVGRVKKTRQQATPTAGSVAYALLLGYATGVRGPELFKTLYMQAQDVPAESCIALAEEAARKGWINFKRVGDVMEVAFPNIITPADMEAIREQS